MFIFLISEHLSFTLLSFFIPFSFSFCPHLYFAFLFLTIFLPLSLSLFFPFCYIFLSVFATRSWHNDPLFVCALCVVKRCNYFSLCTYTMAYT
jgi:hypothetical protein